MEGRAIYRWATTSLPALCLRAVDQAGLALTDIRAFVPHQANLRITESVVSHLGLPADVVVARDIVDSGNTSAASVPLALDRLLELGQVASGDAVLLAGFGAGLTAAAQVIVLP
jgi:3-oxoacyl-[acyl-carrier-protein] synthase-3